MQVVLYFVYTYINVIQKAKNSILGNQTNKFKQENGRIDDFERTSIHSFIFSKKGLNNFYNNMI